MFCKQCGKELADGTKFCGYCGAAQGEGGSVASSKARETAGTQDAAQNGLGDAQGAARNGSGDAQGAAGKDSGRSQETAKDGAASEAKSRRESPRKAGKGKGGLFIALAAVVLFLAVGAGAALYFTGDGYNIAKDLKLAGECFEEGEYREALSYYKDALRRDGTLAEAYLGSVEVYLAQQDREKAKEELKKGLKKVRGDEEAQALLTGKLAEVYLQEAKLHADGGEFAAAYSLIQEGLEETGAAALTDGKAEVYLKEADSYIGNGDNAGALQVLRLGLEDTAGASRQQELRQKAAEIYRMESDVLLAGGDCLAALGALAEGMRETEVSMLAEREAYLRENIVCVRETGPNFHQVEYDTAGNPVRETGVNSAALRYEYKLEYDAAGRRIAEEYKATDGEWWEVRYDENGRPASGSRGGRILGRSVSGQLEYDSASDIAKWTINFTGSDHILVQELIWVGTGDMVQAKEYDNEGYGCFSEYDAAGNLVKETYSDSADNVNIHEYGYDDAGNQVWDKYYDNVGYGYEKTMVYDMAGNILEYTLTENSGDVEYRSYENEYDVMGSLARCTERDRDGNVLKSEEWQYEYLYIGE